MLKRIYLEITNSCNLNCKFCTNEKGNRFLTISQITNVLEQIKPYCNYIYLHILGEPTLHPDFEEILRILDNYDFNLQLVTNGTLLYKYPDILKHKCLRKLSISLHSINDIDISNQYFETINKLIESNEHTYIELRNYINNDYRIKEYISSLINKYSYFNTPKNNSYKIKDNVYIYTEELFNWPNINDNIIGYKGTCHGAIDMLAINSNLDVTLCCLDPYAHNLLGNLANTSFKDIIESNEYKKIKDEFKKHIISKDLCARCSYRLRFEKSNN